MRKTMLLLALLALLAPLAAMAAPPPDKAVQPSVASGPTVAPQEVLAGISPESQFEAFLQSQRSAVSDPFLIRLVCSYDCTPCASFGTCAHGMGHCVSICP